jgi:hypothetical protein
VYREIKLRAIEKVTQSTQTEAIFGLTSELQTEASTLTPEQIANLITSISPIF